MHERIHICLVDLLQTEWQLRTFQASQPGSHASPQLSVSQTSSVTPRTSEAYTCLPRTGNAAASVGTQIMAADLVLIMQGLNNSSIFLQSDLPTAEPTHLWHQYN